MTAAVQKQLKEIFKRYKKYGITLPQVIEAYKSGIEHGMKPQQSIVGVRLALSGACNEHEYFTVADVAAVTGETLDEVTKRIEENKEELLREGGIVEVSSPLPGLFN